MTPGFLRRTVRTWGGKGIRICAGDEGSSDGHVNSPSEDHVMTVGTVSVPLAYLLNLLYEVVPGLAYLRFNLPVRGIRNCGGLFGRW